MKDISATIRRIDHEITRSRQQIAALQVDIARLEDARRVFMGIAETDQETAEGDRMERMSVINGAHAKPVLIVRKTTEDKVTDGKPKQQRRKSERRERPADGSAALRPKIIELLAESAPLTSAEIGDKLGLAPNQDARKGMSNALYSMKHKGELRRSETKNARDRRYSLARER